MSKMYAIGYKEKYMNTECPALKNLTLTTMYMFHYFRVLCILLTLHEYITIQQFPQSTQEKGWQVGLDSG